LMRTMVRHSLRHSRSRSVFGNFSHDEQATIQRLE
jgi:hypothetical protein